MDVDLAFWRRPSGGSPRIVGHRGARGDAPENTLGAFAHAAKIGATAVELDVRVCKTGQLVVLHDLSLSRITSGGDARNVADLTLVELSRVELPGGERVPLLAEVFELCDKAGIGVNVELKYDAPDRGAVVFATARLLAESRPRFPVIVSSFDPRMLRALAPLAPDVPRALIVHRSRYHFAMLALAHIGASRRNEPSRFVHAVHLERRLMTEARVSGLKRRDLLVSVWTVNERTEAERYARMGVDSLMSDDPALLI